MQEASLAPPYQSILVAVDNSKYSDAAVSTAATLAQHQGATVVGLHVYAAQLHERRFLHLEAGLPDRYTTTELERQRSVHESLIAQGLRLISASYLDQARDRCEEAGVPFAGRLAEGKHYEEIIKAARTGAYDLVVLGALGLGARRRSLIGGVCERVLRSFRGDVLVVRDSDRPAQGIVVAIDGSASSLQALARALAVGRDLGRPVEVVTVYDPQFHIVAFQRLAQVLSAEAAALFRFKEQEQLHAEIIDKGLEKLYRSYLQQAADLAAAHGGEVQATLLSGKPFQSVLDHLEKRPPWLLVVGRFGQHAGESSDIGSTTENLVRFAPCSTLVVSGVLDLPERRPLATNPGLPWSPEAEARLQNVSAFAQLIVREAVERYAQLHQCPEITPEVMAQARQEIGW